MEDQTMLAFLSSIPGAAAQGIIWGIMAIGVYITYRILDFADLTVDGSMATGGCVFVTCALHGTNIYVSILIAFIAGCLCGLATAILYTLFGIPPILSGILTQIALYSVNLDIMGSSNEAISSNNFNLIVSMRYNERSIVVALIITAALIAVLYWFFGTEMGHSIRATGNNENMAKANGINTKANAVIALVLSNGIVALSGALLAQYQGYADVNMSRGAIVTGLAAVIIGEVVFGKIFKNFALRLTAVVIGGIIYNIVISLVVSMGLPSSDLKLFTALVVAIFLGVPFWKNNISAKRVKRVEGGAENA